MISVELKLPLSPNNTVPPSLKPPLTVALHSFSRFFISLRGRSSPSSRFLVVAPSFRSGINNLPMAYDDKSAYALCAFSFAAGSDSEPITFSRKTQLAGSLNLRLVSDLMFM
ncbi:hypothetical protein Fmac_020331 [Flemingia macrophylla]|uniref:Uncharacterized protein n=1 Tax=Flemingia macrophylla TaxID=520843 RepID=A0ABD1LTP4_9FABA